MQVILYLTAAQTQRLSLLLKQDQELYALGQLAIEDAKDRERTSAPRIAKKYTLNCEPGVIFSKGSAL